MALNIFERRKNTNESINEITIYGEVYRIGDTVKGREDFPFGQRNFKGEIVGIRLSEAHPNDCYWLTVKGISKELKVRVNDIIDIEKI